MRFDTVKLKDTDIQSLAKILFDWTKNTTFNDTRTLKTLTSQLTDAAKNDDELVIIAYEKSDRIVGWINIFIGFPEMIFAVKWHPIVRPGKDETTIATTLLEEYKRYCVENGRKRIEGQFNKITESEKNMLEKYSKWYESQGFYRVTEEVFMELKMSEMKRIKFEVPNGFDLVTIDKKTNEEIKESFFDTFGDSVNGLFLDQSYNQQVESFNHWFDRERKFIEGASLLLLKDDEVAAFIVTRPHHDQAYIGPVGVNPMYRRRGLGKVLISEVLNASSESGIETITLEMDAKNTPASGLYTSFGFKTLHRTVFYAWLPEGREQ